MDGAQRILALARAELGTREQPAGSGTVKYNTAYYGHAVCGTGYAWCAVFVWWLFQRAGLSQLYYDGGKTAYVPALLAWAERKGWTVQMPRAGDLVCFDFNGNRRADHIGICESWDGHDVTTIDGNTGVNSQASGGCVMRRRRNGRYILGVIRPPYEEKEEMMTQEEFDRRMADYLRRQGQCAPAAWSEQARAWAEERHIVSGAEAGDKQYKKLCTREEVIQLLYNLEHN